jgi:hypothetical protein
MPVVFYVQLCRLGRVVCGVVVVSLSRMRVVRGGLVVAGLVVPGSFAMVLGGVLVMLRSLVMMFCSLV